MRVVVETAHTREIRNLIEQNTQADYVYMYPPRQTYRKFQNYDPWLVIGQSLSSFDKINLYFHFPFCRQTCSFCNLFTVVSEDPRLFETYIGAIERELLFYQPWLYKKRVETLYLGGGTPSLFPASLFERLFRFLQTSIGCNIRDIPEVALEVSPETVEREKFKAFRDLGINRVSLGVQSTEGLELGTIGRRYNEKVVFDALEVVQTIGFDNVCVDLIYGLQGQSFDNWRTSVDAVVRRSAPETICAYALTLRPFTGFNSRGYRHLSSADQLIKYDYCHDALLNHGYRQETHVRYIKNEHGGYRQKMNHWGLQNMLGIGAGARSYLWQCDTRNGYSVRNRNRALKYYLRGVEQNGQSVTDGFIMNDDERRRKAIILGMIDLNRTWFKQLFGMDPADVFPNQFQTLFDLELLIREGNRYKLTSKGMRHRDVIAQMFFSERVKTLLNNFDYFE